MNTKSQNKGTNFKKNSILTSLQQSCLNKDSQSLSNRPSLLSQNVPSLSQVAGVSHLNDKRNSGLLLFKNQQVQSHKRENKLTIDYYTIQSQKPLTAQQSVLQTARNKTQNNHIKQQQQQSLSAQKSNPLVVNVQPRQPPSQVTLRNSIKTEHRKQRAISNNKHLINQGALTQNAQGQGSQINLQWKLTKKNTPNNGLSAIHERNSINPNTKSNYKNSMIVQSNLKSSPKPQKGSQSHRYQNQNIYKSPQQSQKQQNVVFSSSNSPIPNQNQVQFPTFQHQKSISSQQKYPINKNENLSCLSLKNIEEESTVSIYGGNNQKTSSRVKNTSLQNKKKTPVISHSPSIGINKHSNNFCKSPLTSTTKIDLTFEPKKSFKDFKKDTIKVVSNITIVDSKTTEQKVEEQIEVIVNPYEEQLALEKQSSNNLLELQSFSSNYMQDEDIIEEKVKEEEESHLQPIEFDNDNKPMNKERFLQLHKDKLLQYEIEEVNKVEKVYFAGQTITRNESEMQILKSKTEKEILKELDDEEGYYNVLIHDHLAYRYEVLKILGKGSFAQVVACLDHKLGNKVAIKITRNTEIDHKFALSESSLLNFLMKNDPNDNHSIVRMLDEFIFRDHHCFVFELLHSDLFEHLKENSFIGFPTGRIRDFAIQILEALNFLEDHNIIHCDLKPENILLVDQYCEKIKLVDYGSGCFKDQQVYTYVQSRFYRAPEVILRLQYSEKVDIWSFGCILAELYTGEPLFPGNNEQEQLELIMEICGIPPQHVIDKSRKKDHYFDIDYSPFLIEDEELGILRIPSNKRLEDVVECSDQLFLDFIKKCITLDPKERFSAKESLNHPWIKEGLKSHCPPPLQSQITINRKREEDGAKQTICEESPIKPNKDKPKRSYSKILNQQYLFKDQQDENDSLCSTPGKEGGIDKELEKQDSDIRFRIIEKEPVGEEVELKKPHNIQNISQLDQNDVKMVGSFEIVREEDDVIIPRPNESVVPVQKKQQEQTINNEHQINKITITVYQRRNTQQKPVTKKNNTKIFNKKH